MALVPPAVLLSILASGFWCFAILWVDRRFLPKHFQMSAVLAGALFVAGVVLSAFGVRSIYDFVAQL